MDVFVIPIGRDRYELYCEPAVEDDAEPEAAPPRGWLARLRLRFSELLKAAEQRMHVPEEPGAEPKGLFTRLQERTMAWVAERIAEQRLLWNLRWHESAVAVYPQDMSYEQVMTLIRRILQRDYERHRRWMIVDGIAFLFTFIVLGPLFLLIPGVANLPALYFGFRVFGHWMSMRGARYGLHHTSWTGRECPPLAQLRDVVTLDPHARDERVHAIAAELRLQHLSSFFDRVVPQV